MAYFISKDKQSAGPAAEDRADGKMEGISVVIRKDKRPVNPEVGDRVVGRI